jgi:MEMO1 family protein
MNQNSLIKSQFAGSFYPAQPNKLQTLIHDYLAKTKPHINNPAGLIVPHAGYIYSGQTAAYGYSQIQGSDAETVLVLGPSHQVYTEQLTIPTEEAYATPIGPYLFDIPLIKQLTESGRCHRNSIAHYQEHSLEVQFPFLQTILPDSKLVPISVGKLPLSELKESAQAIASMLPPKTIIIISTDLSHFHPLKLADQIDSVTIETILSGNMELLLQRDQNNEVELCGLYPVILGLEILKAQAPIQLTTLHYDTSASASFDNQRVVGYVSIGITRN